MYELSQQSEDCQNLVPYGKVVESAFLVRRKATMCWEKVEGDSRGLQCLGGKAKARALKTNGQIVLLPLVFEASQGTMTCLSLRL